MTWDEYKKQISKQKPLATELIKEAEAEAAIITAIIRQRNAMGLSQRDLASLCNVPQSTIARIESGKTYPRMDTLLKLLQHLNLSLSISVNDAYR